MEKDMIRKYIIFAIKNGKSVIIKTSNEKQMEVNIIGYESQKVQYKYVNGEDISSIKFENIVDIYFQNQEDETDFLYSILGKKYGMTELKKRVQSFEEYYLEIINVLLEKEKKGSIEYINLENKKKIYPIIFKNLLKDGNNLLFYYFTKKQQNPTISKKSQKMRLLIEQANLSQKMALENSFKEKISIIEGPPGTGKTTTILNILANLIYEKKKVLVVSKNNSAVENVIEELENMEIPECFIRMR